MIKSLPRFSKEAGEAGLCPPALLFTDNSGNTLVISSSTEPGKYDAYFTGTSGEGNAASNASFDEITELVSSLFKGSPIPVEVTPPKLEEDETLVFIPGSYYEMEEGWVSTPVEFMKRTDGSMYVRIYLDKWRKIEVPLQNIIEVEFSKGIRLVSRPCVRIKYMNEKGKIRSKKVCMEDGYSKRIPVYAEKISRLLPGKSQNKIK